MGKKYNEVNSSLKLGSKNDQEKNKGKSNEVTSFQWPQTLQDFVNRCFLRAREELTEDKMEIFNGQLQNLIEMAFHSNKIMENNWEEQKLPVLDNEEKLELACLKKPDYKSEDAKKRILNLDYDSNIRKKKRGERFAKELSNPISFTPPTKGKVIIGLSTDLEKNYLRLTSEPNPLNVRPYPVLDNSIKFVLSKFKANKSYSYFINQLKSIRQDLMVQHIKNDFTIYVYETNAKISLQNNDLGEFNQCQSQLNYLYHLKRKSDVNLTKIFISLELEFFIYRLIYMIMMKNYSEVYKLKLMARKLSEFNKNKSEEDLFRFVDILFALNQSRLVGNFYDFFRITNLFRESKILDLGYCVIRNFIFEKEVIRSLLKISKSYRKISLQALVDMFILKNISEFRSIAKKHKLNSFITESNEFDCLNSRSTLLQIISQPNFNKTDIKGQI